MVLALSEPLLATNLLFALIIAGRVSGQPARLRELIGAVILLGGVSALSVARSVTSVQDSVGSPAYWPYVGAAIGATAACFAIAGRRRQGELRALLTGIAAGLVLGIQDALTRVTVRHLGSVHDAAALLISWPAYSLVAVGVIALWLMQSAFNSAPLHASLPGVTAAEPVSGIVLGIVAFREKVPASPLLIAVQVAGLHRAGRRGDPGGPGAGAGQPPPVPRARRAPAAPRPGPRPEPGPRPGRTGPRPGP